MGPKYVEHECLSCGNYTDMEVDLSEFSDQEIAEEWEARLLDAYTDVDQLVDFIETHLWSPSDWERLQNALAVAVKPRNAA